MDFSNFDELKGLNPSQRRATEQLTGPLLVIAGAGSGKTRVLTTRISLLMSLGIMPERILALTFTRKAANEMRERIASLRGADAQRLKMGTFHSVLASMLRPWAPLIGYSSHFTIMDEEDSRTCMRRCIDTVIKANRPPEESQTEEQKHTYRIEDNTYTPKSVLRCVSRLKNRLIDSATYAAQGDPFLDKDMPYLSSLFLEYERACRQAQTMDYDDILLLTWRLLDANPEVRRRMAASFDYILVDEFQDTNVAQYEILRQLSLMEGHTNVCAVGDDSQSIYAFRGAEISNILSFRRSFGDCEVVRLEQNYRSTPEIVQAANRLIAHNAQRIPKECFTTSPEGEPVDVWCCTDERQEAEFTAAGIEENHSKGVPWSEHAVLYRTNSQSRAIEEALIKKRIPYTIYSGVSFYERQEIRDVIAYLRLSVNPHDNEALMRVANRPARALSDATMGTLYATAKSRGVSLYDVLSNPPELKSKALKAIDNLRTLLELCQEAARTMTADRALEDILQTTGILDIYRASDEKEGEDRAANIGELVSAAAIYVQTTTEANEHIREGQCEDTGVTGFLQSVMLMSNADTQGGADTVSLMTVHCAKGLEFENVYVTGMEQGLFPLPCDREKDLEEERRVFYVAVTRAKKKVNVLWTEKRMRFGRTSKNQPSQFIEELVGDISYDD